MDFFGENVSWINLLVYLFASLLFLTGYFSRGDSYFRKNKLVLVIALCLFWLAGRELYIAYEYQSGIRLPSPKEIEGAVFNNRVLVESELVYTSPYGYSLLVPQGYEYVEFEQSAYFLIGKKVSGAFATMLTLKKLKEKVTPLKYLKELEVALRARGSMIRFSLSSRCEPSDCRRLAFTAYHTEGGDDSRMGQGLVIEQDGYLYYLLGLCESGAQPCMGDLERILNSFSVKEVNLDTHSELGHPVN